MHPANLQLLNRIGDAPLLTDGGLETVLVFQQELDLPCFAAIDLLKRTDGETRLQAYYAPFLELAGRHGTGFVLETPTWRASPDWAREIGYRPGEIDELNRAAVGVTRRIRDLHPDVGPTLVSGCIGPRGDGYEPGDTLSAEAYRDFHARQAQVMAEAGADLISAMTMNTIEEALGITWAARDAGLPAVISFTVETDGRLPTGDSLYKAVRTVDDASGNYPLWFMINCAHPTHFESVLRDGGDWLERIGGLRTNASRCSHEELDNSEVLDDGDPAELGDDYRRLRRFLPNLRVFGGCCGTDIRHVRAIAESCLGEAPPARAMSA
ncbi:homocysteine S-methyltransferase family protein [Elongatibacter sediminis]|uniref:Homocysteine S-methyltransferase family protein n=1 Tax=Elongatibacter sediminis TaxID=3119006 RepID=A0AAW9R9Y5_9GAMM